MACLVYNVMSTQLDFDLFSLFLFLLCPRMASVSQFTAEQAMCLLDFGSKMDMTLLDSVVSCFYNTVGPQVR